MAAGTIARISTALQTFIDRITHRYFQSFASVIVITMLLLSDRMITSFRLEHAYGEFISTIKLKVAPAFNEENLIDGEPTNGRLDEKFRATRDGQLFVYLNKPVSGVFPGLFHDLNSGKARIKVYRVPR